MAKHKYIYWSPDMGKNEKGEIFANVHLLIGYNRGTITDLQAMADEIMETFPQATYETICAGKVTESRYVNGFTIVAWNGHIPEGKYPGWSQIKGKKEYSW